MLRAQPVDATPSNQLIRQYFLQRTDLSGCRLRSIQRAQPFALGDGTRSNLRRESCQRRRTAPGSPGMARWPRLYHEWVARVFPRRLYWPRLADAGTGLGIGV